METVNIAKFRALNVSANPTDVKSGWVAWSVRNGYPRLTARLRKEEWTETPDWSNTIIAPMDTLSAITLIRDFRAILDKPGPISTTMVCKNNVYVNSQKTDEIQEQARIILGKDEKGINYILVKAKDKGELKCELLPNSAYIQRVDTVGDSITDIAKLSNDHTISYLELLTALLYRHAVVVTTSKALPTPVVKNDISVDDLG